MHTKPLQSPSTVCQQRRHFLKSTAIMGSLFALPPATAASSSRTQPLWLSPSTSICVEEHLPIFYIVRLYSLLLLQPRVCCYYCSERLHCPSLTDDEERISSLRNTHSLHVPVSLQQVVSSLRTSRENLLHGRRSKMNDKAIAPVVDREVDGRKSVGHLVAPIRKGQNARGLFTVALDQTGMPFLPSLHGECKL